MASRGFGMLGKSVFRRISLALSLVLAASLGLLAQASSASAASVPGPPTKVTALAGNAQAAVSWTTPASDGGSAITGYTVTSIPPDGTASAPGTATSATITGLANSTSYRFVVTATNTIGDSAVSASSDPVTPTAPTAPDAPVITNVTARDSAVQVSWTPPDTGAADLTKYLITVYKAGSKLKTASESATATAANVGGLTNGTGYQFTIAAVNAVATGPASPKSVAVAPRPATPPMPPGALRVVPQNGQVQVAWTAPPDDGSAITGYTVSVSPATVPPVTTPAGTTIATVTGLANGTAYTVSVTAANAAGTSPSAQAKPVTPAASIAPGAPGNLSAAATAAGTVALQWVPPATPGTSAITTYTVTAKAGGTTAATQDFPATACTGSPVMCKGSMAGLSSTASYTFTVTATSGDGISAASAPSDTVTADLVVKKAPVVLSSASVATLRRIAADGTLYFDQPPSQVTGLTAGKLVKIKPVSAVPHGFLGKVVQVTTQGGLVAVSTSRATLADEYSSYGASVNVPINSASVHRIFAQPGVSLARPTVAGNPVGGRASSANPAAPAGAGITWSNGSLTVSVDTDLVEGESPQGQEPDAGPGPVAQVSGSITFTPHLSASLALPDATVHMSADVSGGLSANLGVQLSQTKTFLLGEFGDGLIPTPVGPQDLTFSVSATLATNGTVGISVDASVQQTVGTDCTFSVLQPNAAEDGCMPSHRDSGSGLNVKSALYGAMDAKLSFPLGITWEIEDLAGPSLTLSPWVEGKVDTSANPWQDISVGASIGMAIKALNDCVVWACLPGITLWSNASLFSAKIADIWNSGGPFQGLVLSPKVAMTGTGGSVKFTATTPAGQVSGSSVTWTVLTGPGFIDSSGAFTATGNGIAVVEATYQGDTARAGVVVHPALVGPELDDFGINRGLPDAVLASWSPPDSGTVAPVSYTITARAAISASAAAGQLSESAVVPFPETYAYLPNLAAGVPYSVTVSAVGADGTSISAKSETLTPLDVLPAALGGSGSLQDVSSLSGLTDRTGTAGVEGAAISGDGRYAFYLVSARSPLAPASVFSPVGTSNFYAVRQPLFSPSTIEVASVGLDGNPVEAGALPGASALETNEDGSAVVFQGVEGTGALVHDFTTDNSWSINPPAGYSLDNVSGLADDGTVVFSASNNALTVTHVYRQPMNGAPVQIDNCTAADGLGGCGGASISADGNLIVYGGPPGPDNNFTTYLYNSETGSNANLFPGNTSAGDFVGGAILSADGSHIAVQYISADDTSFGLAVKPLDGSKITGSDLVVNGKPGDSDRLLTLSNDGKTMVYSAQDGRALLVDRNRETLRAPGLQTTTAVGTFSSLTSDGATFLYTLFVTSTTEDYPGVFEWRLP